jgi:drug/metabolite transporter (DMT)-like permease
VTPRNAALSWLSLITVYLVWGSTYLGIRLAVATIPPYLMTGARYIVAGSLLFALQWIFVKEKPALPKRESLLPIAITAILLIVIGNGMLCIVETRVETGTSALLIATTPIWMLIIDAFIERKLPNVWAITGVALGTAGIVLLVGRGSGHVNFFYASLLIVGSISWAAGPSTRAEKITGR